MVLFYRFIVLSVLVDCKDFHTKRLQKQVRSLERMSKIPLQLCLLL